MLGSIVITRTSPLDPLFADLPIVIVDDWNAVRDPAIWCAGRNATGH